MQTDPTQYPPGTRIYYTGDMANQPSTGTIIATHPPTRFGGQSVDIRLDDDYITDNPPPPADNPHIIRMLLLTSFAPGPGQRFHLLTDWLQARREALKQYTQPTTTN